VNRASLIANAGPADAVLPLAPGFLGLLMLDTRFPRPPGDVGHPASFGVPVRQRVVAGAFPQRVVASAPALRAAGLEAAFRAAALELQAEGARAITTSCGFLVLLQDELQAALSVPLATSSLLLLPALLRGQPQVGVLTISAQRLGPDHLLAAGVPASRLDDVLVQGMDAEGPFAAAILGNQPALDFAAAEADVVAAALALRARAPSLRTLVLECTNMPPYAQALRGATGWQVLGFADLPALAWARP